MRKVLLLGACCAIPTLGAAAPGRGQSAISTALPTGDGRDVRELMMAWAGPVMSFPDDEALSLPVMTGRLSSVYGVRSDPLTGRARHHLGIDMPGAMGTPVRAAADGMVIYARRAGGYGNLVEILHGAGLETRYGHLSQIDVASGTAVRRGDVIGLMGSTGRSTGSHLHFEVRVDGQASDPLDRLELRPVAPAMPSQRAHAHWLGWSAVDVGRLPTPSFQ